jgi:hypothetical protein
MSGVQLGGCLMFGVDSVRMAAAQVVRLGGRSAAEREVWRPITVDPAAHRERMSPDRLSGWLCPPCADAVETVGAIGQTAMHRALETALQTNAAARWATVLVMGMGLTLLSFVTGGWELRYGLPCWRLACSAAAGSVDHSPINPHPGQARR